MRLPEDSTPGTRKRLSTDRPSTTRNPALPGNSQRSRHATVALQVAQDTPQPAPSTNHSHSMSGNNPKSADHPVRRQNDHFAQCPLSAIPRMTFVGSRAANGSLVFVVVASSLEDGSMAAKHRSRQEMVVSTTTGAAVLALGFLAFQVLDVEFYRFPGLILLAGLSVLAAVAGWVVARLVRVES